MCDIEKVVGDSGNMCDIEIVVGIDMCGLKKVMIIEF